jgi:heme exporter protein B
LALFRREWRIGRRVGGTGSMGVVFFLILVSIIPFAVGPDLVLLARIGPALLWIAALLATLLGLDRLFQGDDDDGSLDLLLMSETPLEAIVLVKCLVHWLLTGVPLIVATPIFSVMLGLEPKAIFGVTLSLLAGTPALTLVGAIGGLLLAILILPLCVPVLIFGVSAAQAAAGGTVPFMTPFAILLALSLAALAGAPFAAALALRQARI